MFYRFLILAISIPLFFCLPAGAQTVDELIQKNIDAHGGLAKLKAVQSMRLTGRMILPQGMEVPVVGLKKRPNLLRYEITMQGLTEIDAYDGQAGWQIDPTQGGSKDPRKMPPEDSEDIMLQADFDGPLVDYKEKGHAVELIGKEDVEGTPAYKVKLTLKTGQVRYIYLDADSGLELKSTRIVKREGVEKSVESYFGDYKTVDGLVFPFTIELKQKGETGLQFVFDKIEPNVPLDDSIFKMPAVVEQSQPTQ